MKLTLDTATSLLLFHGQYAPTYQQRADKLFSIRRFARHSSGFNRFAARNRSRIGLVHRMETFRRRTGRARYVGVGPGNLRTRPRRLIWELQQLTGSGAAQFN